MSFPEAIAAQPAWVGVWLNVLFLGAFILPLALLVWKPSRVSGIATLLGSVLAGALITWMYGTLGYVKLLGLPHIVIWTPLVFFLIAQARRAGMPVWPRRIIWLIVATLLVSLAFDYTDVIRYLLGERTPMAGTL
ncbi:MAG: hypothetical protein WBB25_17320 [Sulfitobacter sp.]